MKNRELSKEAFQIFWPIRGIVFENTARSEDEKDGAKPTPDKTDFSITSGIHLINHISIRQPFQHPNR